MREITEFRQDDADSQLPVRKSTDGEPALFVSENGAFTSNDCWLLSPSSMTTYRQPLSRLAVSTV